MTDSRAALEERAAKFDHDTQPQTNGEIHRMMADFVEQESSSLKLLLSAMCKGLAKLEHFITDEGTIWVLLVSKTPHSLPVELDSSGIPVITEEILKALEAAK